MTTAYRVLLVGQVIALLGSQISSVALPWFVLVTTGSAAQMAGVLVAESLALATVGVPAGAIVDRVNGKWLMVSIDCVRAVTTLLIPVLALQGSLAYWMILAIAAVQGALGTPYLAARMALVPGLVGLDHRSLITANTWIQMAQHATAIAGPALAGFVIAAVGNITTLFTTAAAFAAAGVFVAIGVQWRAPVTAPRGTWRAEVAAGLAFIMANDLLRAVLLIGMAAQVAVTTMLSAVLPVFVRSVLGGDAAQLGLLQAAVGGGATVGMLVYAAINHRLPWHPGMAACVFLVGVALPVWLIPLFPTLGSAMFALGLNAMFSAPCLVLVQTLLQTATPPEVRGRVFSAGIALWQLATPLGLAAAGPLLERFGALPVLAAISVVLTGVAGAAWLSGAIRQAQRFAILTET